MAVRASHFAVAHRVGRGFHGVRALFLVAVETHSGLSFGFHYPVMGGVNGVAIGAFNLTGLVDTGGPVHGCAALVTAKANLVFVLRQCC